MTKKHNQACADTYYQRGLVHAEKGELDKTIADYTEAIALKPDYAEVYYQRGFTYRIKEDYKHAIRDYTKAIEIDPHNADAYYSRSKAWLHLGAEEKAKSDRKIASNIGINSTTAINETLRNYERAWKTLGNL